MVNLAQLLQHFLYTCFRMIKFPLHFFQFPLWLLFQEQVHDVLVQPVIWFSNSLIFRVVNLIFQSNEGRRLYRSLNLFHIDFIECFFLLILFLLIICPFLDSRSQLSGPKQFLLELAFHFTLVAYCVCLGLCQQRVFYFIVLCHLFDDLSIWAKEIIFWSLQLLDLA